MKKKLFKNIKKMSSENLEMNLQSKRTIPSFHEIEKRIFGLFHKKYFISNNIYGKLIINNIIYNEKSHIVAKFKDFLVIDDLSEFLKRYYKRIESQKRLPLYFEYYFLYSKIFPNYTAIKESKYIYKNIHRKQKMIDLQQEEEEESGEKGDKNKEIRESKENNEKRHQRKKNKIEKNTIFNNDIYESIMKQSQDLYMILFGIDKNKKKNEEISNSFNSLEIKEIVTLIEKYDYESKIGFNYKNSLIIPKINKVNHQKKYIKKENNSSLTTKQSTFNSSVIQQKIKNFGKLYKNKNDIIIGLKKIKNEKNKTITSNSLLMPHKLSKNNLGNNPLKNLKSIQFVKSKENSKSKPKSIKKEIKNANKITVNQILLMDDKKMYLTDRTSVHNKYQNLQFDFHNNYSNKKNKNIININNNKLRVKILNKKSIDFNNYSKINTINNTKKNRHKRINTNINETSRIKSYKINLFNRIKVRNKKSDNRNNKLKINIKEIRDFIKNNTILEKKCCTERESRESSVKEKKKDKLQYNRIKDNLFKKINSHKRSVPSIDFKKRNKNLLLSHRILSSSKINKYNFQTNFLPLPFKENLTLNKNQIINKYNGKISSNIDKIEDKYLYSERGSAQYQKKSKFQDKIKLIVPNDFPFLKKIETKYYNTTSNSKNKDRYIINNKENNNINNTFHKKRIYKEFKQIKRKELSLIEFNEYIILNNIEKNRKYFYNKILLNSLNKK